MAGDLSGNRGVDRRTNAHLATSPDQNARRYGLLGPLGAKVIVVQGAEDEVSVIGRETVTLESRQPIGHGGGKHRHTGIGQWQRRGGAALPDCNLGRNAAEYGAA
jgi:hypothetical protein